MDQNEDQNLQKFEKHNKFHFLKRTLQLLVSVSLFSLVLCCYYGFPLFPHSFNIYFSTFLLSFFTHTLERKYMFLICNVGIIAFLSKKSSVSCSSSTEMKSSSDFVNEEVHVGVGSLQIVTIVAEEEQKQKDEKQEEEEGEGEGEGEAAAVIKEAKDQEQDIWSTCGEENERESEVLIAENEGKEEESVPLIKQVQEAASEASTDELNKKFEEFIRKMKEELRIQAHQQLIAV